MTLLLTWGTGRRHVRFGPDIGCLGPFLPSGTELDRPLGNLSCHWNGRSVTLPKPFESWIKGDSKVEPIALDKDVFGDGTVIMLRTRGGQT